MHNDSALVLSESNDSYIIANRESYDKSQYPDDPGKAGQGFGHALVIPRKRVYNVVDPDATKDRCKLLQEMKQHFIGFWKTAIGQKKLVEATWEGVCARNNTLKRANRALDEKDLEEQERRFNDFAGKYKALNADRDFHYVVHPHPYHSVGHLHLHVFPSNSELRSRSPRSHDWKSIPLDVITRLEDEEEIERKKKAPRPSTPRKDWELLHPGTGPPTSGASAGSNIHHIRPGAATRR